MINKIHIIILLGCILSACNVLPKNQDDTIAPYILTDDGINSKIKLSEIPATTASSLSKQKQNAWWEVSTRS